jgi:putative ABC transport system permease protein
VGWYIVKIADPSQAQQMGARFDAMFANSSAETKTTTEKGFVEGFAKQVGDIGAIMIAILAAVLFTMMLVAANTMAQSVRERTSEVGVLKTLGFTNLSILALVLGEALLIVVIGGGLGLLASWLFVQQGDPTGGMLPIFTLPPRDVAVGAVLIVVLGIVAGLWPAITAMQLRITDALRRG